MHRLRACVQGRLSPRSSYAVLGHPREPADQHEGACARRKEHPSPHVLGLVARYENGDSDETCSSPCDRVRCKDPDLIAARTQGSQVIDGGLQRATRIPGRHGTSTRVNLERTVRVGGPRSPACHAFNLPLRRAAKRSSSSRASDWPPQPRTSSRTPSDIDSRLISRSGPGAPRFPAGRTLPRSVRSPSPISTSWVVAARSHPFG